MPTKIIESKLIIKGEDQATPKLSGLLRFIDRLALKMERLGKIGLTEPGQGYRTGVGRGSQRSEHAPPVGERYVSAPGGGYANILRQMGIPGAGGGSPPSPNRPLPPGVARVSPGDWRPPPGGGGGRGEGGGGWGWGKGIAGRASMIGAGVGAATALMGASGGQLTPVVGGMLMAAGAAISPALWGAGTLVGGPMMAAGGLMTMASHLVQPAFGHYGALGDQYRRMGDPRAVAARTLGAKYGFSPEESIKIAGDLTKVGGYHGFGVMARMRGGGFGAEEMGGFFTAATRAGAAGGREKAEYERLGKILGAAFAKEGKLPSIAQAIDVVAGLMGLSEQHLADLSDDQTKQMTAWAQAWETGPTAMMKGQRGLQKTGGLWGAIAGPQEPAMDMFLYQILSKSRPGMTQFEYQKMKESGIPAMRPIIDELAKLPIEQGAPLLSVLSKGAYDYTQAETFLKSWKSVGASYDKQTALLDEAKLKTQGIDLKGKSPKADLVQSEKAMIELRRLAISEQEKIIKAYADFENRFLALSEKMLTNDGLVTSALVKLNEAMDYLEEKITGEPKEDREGRRLRRDMGVEEGISFGKKGSIHYGAMQDIPQGEDFIADFLRAVWRFATAKQRKEKTSTK